MSLGKEILRPRVRSLVQAMTFRRKGQILFSKTVAFANAVTAAGGTITTAQKLAINTSPACSKCPRALTTCRLARSRFRQPGRQTARLKSPSPNLPS